MMCCERLFIQKKVWPIKVYLLLASYRSSNILSSGLDKTCEPSIAVLAYNVTLFVTIGIIYLMKLDDACANFTPEVANSS